MKRCDLKSEVMNYETYIKYKSGVISEVIEFGNLHEK